MNTNTSEVARIKQQIAAEYAAAELGLSGYAQVTRHAFIAKRMNNIDTYRQQLSGIVGEEEATRIVIQTVWPTL